MGNAQVLNQLGSFEAQIQNAAQTYIREESPQNAPANSDQQIVDYALRAIDSPLPEYYRLDTPSQNNQVRNSFRQIQDAGTAAIKKLGRPLHAEEETALREHLAEELSIISPEEHRKQALQRLLDEIRQEAGERPTAQQSERIAQVELDVKEALGEPSHGVNFQSVALRAYTLAGLMRQFVTLPNCADGSIGTALDGAVGTLTHGEMTYTPGVKMERGGPPPSREELILEAYGIKMAGEYAASVNAARDAYETPQPSERASPRRSKSAGGSSLPYGNL